MSQINRRVRVTWAFVSIVVLMGAVASPPLTHAAPLTWPPQTLQAPTQVSFDEEVEVGWIELYVLVGNWQDPWTLVQWKDNQGDWVDVNGWRGQFDAIQNGVGIKTWAVDPANFGMGPLRWIVYEKASGAIVAKSSEFYLPTELGQAVPLEVVP